MKAKKLNNSKIKIPNNIFFIGVFLLPFLLSFTKVQDIIGPPPEEKPLKVSVSLRINKIYTINTVNESYKIDGYLIYTWVDERVRCLVKYSSTESIIYENERAIELMKSVPWIPTFELINEQGPRQISNIWIEMLQASLIPSLPFTYFICPRTRREWI